MTVLDAAGLWDPKGDQQGFILVYGVRILDQRASIDATISPISGGTIAGRRDTHDTFVDALLGARFNHRFGRHWNVQAQADASTGGTDHTWSAGPSLGYAFGDAGRHSITAGYRHMAVDFADDGEVAPAMTLSGAVLGYRFSF